MTAWPLSFGIPGSAPGYSFPNKTKSKSRTKKGWRGMNNKGGMEADSF